MRNILIFLMAVFLFGDVSDTILKIKYIENNKKQFLKIDYNIFMTNEENPISSPIIFEKPKKYETDLKLYAIFNNKVNINSRWYNKGDFVNGYKIVKILDDKVLLKKNSRIKILKIKSTVLKVK